MRPGLIISGIAMVFFAIPCYIILPPLMQDEIDRFNGPGMASSMNRQIFDQLGIPPMDSLIPITKYLFIGMAVAGLGVIGLGSILKTMPKQVTLKVNLDQEPKVQLSDDPKTKAIQLLQERLARGEITSSQYQNLKKLMEEKK